MSKIVVIQPRSSKNVNELVYLINRLGKLNHLTHYDLPTEDKNTGKLTRVSYVFTYPCFKFTKPERVSRKTGKNKKQSSYIAVYDPRPLGCGSYGAAYTVIGVWKLSEALPFFKLKTDPAKQQVVKTNGLIDLPNTPDTILTSYNKEYTIGKWVPHMGYRYPVTTWENAHFLLMRKQPGVSMDSLINTVKQNPAYFTAPEYLTLIVNLFKMLEEKIHNIVCEGDFLVHNDLKPENLIIDGFDVYPIDFGYAAFSKVSGRHSGTILYKDFELMMDHNHKFVSPTNPESIKKTPDRVTDLYSMTRVVDNLLNEQIELKLSHPSQIKQRNIENQRDLPLDQIADLTNEEKNKIRNLLSSLTAFSSQQRPSYAQTLAVFEQLLKDSLARQQRRLDELANTAHVLNISDRELQLILNGPQLEILIARITNDAQFKDIFIRLKDKVQHIKPEVVAKLKARGLSLAKSYLFASPIFLDNLSAASIERLLALGATLDEAHIQDWLVSSKITPRAELEWIAKCRLFCRIYPQPERFKALIAEDVSFKSLFLHHFLFVAQEVPDDVFAVRVIKLERAQDEALTKLNGLLNTYFSNTALATLLQKSTLFTGFKPKLDYAILINYGELHRIYTDISKLAEISHYVSQLKWPEEDNCRRKLYDSCNRAILEITALQTGDFDSSFEKLPVLYKAYQYLIELKKLDLILEDVPPCKVLMDIKNKIDSFYALRPEDPIKFVQLKKTELLKLVPAKSNNPGWTAGFFSPQAIVTQGNDCEPQVKKHKKNISASK